MMMEQNPFLNIELSENYAQEFQEAIQDKDFAELNPRTQEKFITEAFDGICENKITQKISLPLNVFKIILTSDVFKGWWPDRKLSLTRNAIAKLPSNECRIDAYKFATSENLE